MGRMGLNHVCLLPPRLLFKMEKTKDGKNQCEAWWVGNILLILMKLMRYR